MLEVGAGHGWYLGVMARTGWEVVGIDLYPADPVALLSKCSHLGCAVQWDGDGKKFRCPCHGGVYDEHGNVESGPPPRPLTRLDVKIENDVCFVRLPGDEQQDATA